MAEAIVNHTLPAWQAFSAGTDPAGYVHPVVLDVLKEIDINHQGTSKNASAFQETKFDLVVTVCDDARETCPVWLGEGQVVHRGFEDPAEASGSPEEIKAVFRKVRDQIQEAITQLLREQQQKG
jgi:arsenate reductase